MPTCLSSELTNDTHCGNSAIQHSTRILIVRLSQENKRKNQDSSHWELEKNWLTTSISFKSLWILYFLSNTFRFSNPFVGFMNSTHSSSDKFWRNGFIRSKGYTLKYLLRALYKSFRSGSKRKRIEYPNSRKKTCLASHTDRDRKSPQNKAFSFQFKRSHSQLRTLSLTLCLPAIHFVRFTYCLSTLLDRNLSITDPFRYINVQWLETNLGISRFRAIMVPTPIFNVHVHLYFHSIA